MNFAALLKHTASTLVALTVLLAALQAIIIMSGGRVPPWMSEHEIQMMIDMSMQTMATKWNSDKCADFNARYLRSQQILRQMPGDPAALLQYTDFNNTIDSIPNCHKAMLP